MHGLELIKDIRAQHKRLPVLVFTMHEESVYAERALRAGAQGYLMKQERPERLMEALRTLMRGDYAISSEFTGRILRAMLHPHAQRPLPSVRSLGDRELEVFQLIGQGIGTREIATRLGRSVKTIETYRSRIKEKLELKTATDLVRHAVRWVETGQ
jgi:DNA-binding NarL/FixJ family response regulator